MTAHAEPDTDADDARFRAEVPLGVSPHAEELFEAGTDNHGAERSVVRAHRTLFARVRMPWRLAIAAGASVPVTPFTASWARCPPTLLQQADVSGPGVRPRA